MLPHKSPVTIYNESSNFNFKKQMNYPRVFLTKQSSIWMRRILLFERNLKKKKVWQKYSI